MNQEVSRTRLALAGVVALLGLAFAGTGAMWVAGSLSISTAAATQIVDAIMVGGFALQLVMAVFGGGIISAIVATVMWKVKKIGKGLAIA